MPPLQQGGPTEPRPVGLRVLMCSQLRSVLPVLGGSLGAPETIPKKEQSEGKLIPNGALSPLRSKVGSLSLWFLGAGTEAHNAILQGFLFIKFNIFLLL